jgi:5-oxoprolinase (ATP-hydrolysing) subunit C
MPTIEVIRPGALTTVQDLGRAGHGASGVPRGGAFDPWAARAANRLVGNPDGAALLEITLAGPTLELDGVAAIALVGDPFEIEAELDTPEGSTRIETGMEETIPLKGKTRLTIGRVTSGVRAWLAVAGGIDVPSVLGSRSTDLAGAFGGHEGRALRAGDRLLGFPSKEDVVPPRRRERVRADPEVPRLRILEGPDGNLIQGGGLEELVKRDYRVSPSSDRRGVRLEGAALELVPHPPLRSQGVLPGAVQIPPTGEPIVLGVDPPVTGGYPWAAQVIAADLALLAHLAPGAAVRFERIDLEAAEAALAARERDFAPESGEP